MKSTIPQHGLLLRADDFGASPGTNDAILAAVAAGHILNIGTMAPGPSIDHRWNELLEIQEHACVGVHATLNSEWQLVRWKPLSPDVSTLVEADGTFHRTTQATARSARPEEIVREVRAQIDALRRRGLNPRYLDTHMGFHWIPGVDTALTQLCKCEGLIYAHTPGFTTFRCPTSMEGMDLQKAVIDQALNEVAQPCLVWIFHPAHNDSVTRMFYLEAPSENIAANRAREAALLENTGFVTLLRELHGVELMRYDEAVLRE
jgi:predicted glycoside hydrolase/deacetylase ChbG (UPF0249 family)